MDADRLLADHQLAGDLAVGAACNQVDKDLPLPGGEAGYGPMCQLQLRAMQALYDAEVLRGRADPRAATAWRHAAEACRDAELAWDEAYARRRAAEALLQARATRQHGVVELRRAHELATDLEAAPLLVELRALARSSRVPLTDPRTVPAEMVTGILSKQKHHVAGQPGQCRQIRRAGPSAARRQRRSDCAGADRRQHGQSTIGQPGQHVHQHVQRALIRPVQVVHDQDHRPPSAEAGQPRVELKRSITGPGLTGWP